MKCLDYNKLPGWKQLFQLKECSERYLGGIDEKATIYGDGIYTYRSLLFYECKDCGEVRESRSILPLKLEEAKQSK